MKIRFVFTLLISFAALLTGNAQITYDMEIKNFSPAAIGSYPQQILKIGQTDSSTRVRIRVEKASEDKVKRELAENDLFSPGYSYPPEVAAYLEVTPLVNKENAVIAAIADTLFDQKQETIRIIEKGLKFVSTYIVFDDSLALEISKGNCRTLPVEDIIERRKGTCSEYTGLFLALMRKKGIPARFIAGFIYMPEQNFSGCHAWAECYIKNYGWLAVDPQNGRVWIPPTAIKLFAGKDFNQCGLVSFADLVPSSIRIVEKEK